MGRQQKDYNCKLFPFERTDVLSMQEVSQKAGWNITAFDLPKAWSLTEGEGIVIAVIDSGCDLDHPDLVHNLLPGINLIERDKPPEDDCGHGCVDPDCLVHTNFCGVERIETLYNRIDAPVQFTKTTDGVIHSKDVSRMNLRTFGLDKENKSKISKVLAIHKMPVNGQVVEVVLEGDIHYKLTPWHPVYVSNTKNGRAKIVRKRADQLTKHDRFVFVDRNLSQALTNDYYRVSAEDYYECCKCGHRPLYRKRIEGKTYHCKKCKGSQWRNRKKEYLLNEDLAYLVGVIATDGYYTRKSYRAEITSVTPEILHGIADICQNYNFGHRIKNRRILINSKSLTHLLYNLGLPEKDKSLNLQLPEFVGKSPIAVIRAFLAGVIDGDGCISKNNTKNRIVTASLQFADYLCALLNSIGVSASKVTVNDKREHTIKGRKVRKQNILYHVVFSSLPSEIAAFLLHPTKKQRASKVVSRIRKSRGIKSIQFIPNTGYFYDFTTDSGNYIGNGHYVSNTHMTGILVAENNDFGIVGVCPKAKVRPIKVLDKDGNGNLLNVAEGIRWATEQKVNFISMSMGAPVPVQQVRKAIQAAQEKGIVTFVSAGNAGNTKEVFYPAAYPEVISVGAIDEHFRRASFSNTGKRLDFMAPGVDILSTVPDDWYAILSGTSMAQPFACGVAALLLSYVRAHNIQMSLNTAEDYRRVFRQYTTPVSNGNYSDPAFYQGFGIIDPRKFLEAMNQQH